MPEHVLEDDRAPLRERQRRKRASAARTTAGSGRSSYPAISSISAVTSVSFRPWLFRKSTAAL